MADLLSLPAPQVIEVPDTEQILQGMVDMLVDEAPETEATLALESSLLRKFLRVSALRSALSQSQVNDAVRSRLVGLATGGALDHLGVDFGVDRLPGESDDAFRERINLSNRGRSTGGSKYWYEAAARRASVLVKSATVYRDPILPIITIAILSTLDGGIPSDELLEIVRAEVTGPRVRLVNDTIVVEAAVSSATDIELDVWLLPTAPSSLITQIPDTLRAAWSAEAGVGFDLEPSWIRARSHLAGVKRVDVLTPDGPVIASDGEALAIGQVTVNFKGYDY